MDARRSIKTLIWCLKCMFQKINSFLTTVEIKKKSHFDSSNARLLSPLQNTFALLFLFLRALSWSFSFSFAAVNGIVLLSWVQSLRYLNFSQSIS